jgi:hypothetical protein
MMRTQTLIITTAIALALPFAAIAQTPSSTTKCGPVAFSTERMNYSSAPCAGGESAGTVGTSGPTVVGANNSSSMTKAEMKQGAPAGYGYAPMPVQQAQAVSMGPNSSMGMAPMADQCGPSNAAAIKDEYGRKYNCRGDRVR